MDFCCSIWFDMDNHRIIMVYFYLSPSGVIKRAWGIPYETNGRIPGFWSWLGENLGEKPSGYDIHSLPWKDPPCIFKRTVNHLTFD